VYGEDDYLAGAKASALVQALVPPQERDFGLETIDGAAGTVDEALQAMEQSMAALKTPGFFGGRKVVWLKDASFLSDDQPGRSEPVRERVNALAALIKAGLDEGQTLVVSARRVDKRYAFYKACKAAGELHEFAMPDKAYLAERQATERLHELLADRGLRMPSEVRQLFLGRVGNETRRLAMELDKLCTYMGGKGTVTRDDIEAVVTASHQAMAWDLADAFGERNLERCLELVRQLLFQKESPIGLVIGLQSRVRDLLVYREARQRKWLTSKSAGSRSSVAWGRVPPEVETIFTEKMARDPRKTHPYRVGVLAGQAGRFTLEELHRCRRRVVEAHETLVSSRLQPSLVLEMCLIDMLS
jgi:DNA polymerase-3 subunit delta